MKTRSFFAMAMLGLALTTSVSLTLTSCDAPEVINPGDNGNTGGDDDQPGGGDDVTPTFELPDSIKNGNNFYCIFLGEEETAALGNKVKEPTMLRDYDIWPGGESLAAFDRLGVNAFGAPEGWIAFDHAAWAEGWNGGAIVAVLSEFEKVPDLSVIDESYTFHFATKSPNNQKNAGFTLFFYSEGTELKYFFGPKANCPADQKFGGDYTHDGEWHHFEIPVSTFLEEGWLWTGPLAADNDRRYLIGFQGSPHVAGTELNLDAMFFYQKPAK